MDTWTLAAVQTDIELGQPAANRRRLLAGLEAGAGRGARLVVFPECAVQGYCFRARDEALALAETLPGPSTEAMTAACRRLGVFTVFGLLETAHGRLFNSLALVGPDGLIGTYRKTHLPCLGVDRFTTPGDRPYEVHDLGGLRIGMLICYDGSFPEPCRALALAGADLIVLPTNWPPEALRSARLLTPARALENRVYFMAVNRVGRERGFRFIGQSQIADVSGELIADAPTEEETLLTATIDPARARKKRVVFVPGEYEVDRISHRRPELYGPLVRAVQPPINE